MNKESALNVISQTERALAVWLFVLSKDQKMVHCERTGDVQSPLV
jgi:hypothetical protein